MYKINDIVVYKHDLCKLKEIKEDYYIFTSLKDKSLTIQLPISNNNIRYALTKDEALSIIKDIPNIKTINVNEKNLENEYKTLYKTCDLKDLIKIIKTSYLYNQERIKNNLKIIKKNDDYLKLAETALYQEFAIALNIDKDEVSNYISDYLKKCVELS